MQVVLVEEAAEVMEVHTLAALAPSVEHVILIGDHEQLRPKAQLWEMQVKLHAAMSSSIKMQTKTLYLPWWLCYDTCLQYCK